MPLYDNWTWDSLNKILTIAKDDVKGYSEGTKFTLSDIEDAIIAKGWLDVDWTEHNSLQFTQGIRLIIAIDTYFGDTAKQIRIKSTAVSGGGQIHWDGNSANAHIIFGELIDATQKVTARGIQIIVEQTGQTTITIVRGGTATNSTCRLYSCNFICLNSTTYGAMRIQVGRSGYNAPIYNCTFDYVTLYSPTVDLYNPKFESRTTTASEAIRNPVGTLEKIHATKLGILLGCEFNVSRTLKNVVVRLNTYVGYTYYSNVSHYLINVDADTWAFSWGTGTGANAKFFRQYEFDTHVQDRDSNPLSGVSAVAEYISPYGQAFSTTTDANGDIATQTVDHGWFQQSTGNTENLKTPLKVTYKKAGYKTVVKYYSLNEKTEDRVVLQKTVDIIFVNGKPALNLNESDPENELYAVM